MPTTRANKKLIWSRLKDMKCPNCGNYINPTETGYECGTDGAVGHCDFKIGKERFDEVVTNLYKPRAKRIDNLSALNNL